MRIILIALALTGLAHAHQPVVARGGASLFWPGTIDASRATSLPDPTRSSSATYGRLTWPNEVDLYTFTTDRDTTIPVEALVPIRPFNRNLRPAVLIVGRELNLPVANDPPLRPPEGFQASIVTAPEQDDRTVFFEPFSLEKLYHGSEVRLAVKKGHTYYVAVYSPQQTTGSYSLGLGTVEDFRGVSVLNLLSNIFAAKLESHARPGYLWWDLLGVGILLLAIGLGLGGAMLSPASQAAQFVAVALLVISAVILYRESGISGVAVFQAVLLVPIVAALFRRHVRERSGWSLGGWILELLLASWYLVLLR